MGLQITWKREVPYPDGLQEYSADIAGYEFFIYQTEKGSKQKKWSWSVWLELPEEMPSYVDPIELSAGEADTLARAMSAAVKSLKKISRSQLRELKALHAAKTASMKIIARHIRSCS